MNLQPGAFALDQYSQHLPFTGWCFQLARIHQILLYVSELPDSFQAYFLLMLTFFAYSGCRVGPAINHLPTYRWNPPRTEQACFQALGS